MPFGSALKSTFDSSNEGWRPGNDASLSWQSEGGNPSGFLQGDDLGDGRQWYYISPESWSGDWTSYVGGKLSFDLRLISTGGGEEFSADILRIYGSNGNFVSWSGTPPRGSWTHYEVDLTPSVFGISDTEFREIMGDVSEIWIRGEYTYKHDVEGLDNVMVTVPMVLPGIAKIGFGSTPKGSTNWVEYYWDGNLEGIYVDVDTSSAGFTSTPVYVTSLVGDANQWSTTGASSIYAATPSSFRVYVRWWDGNSVQVTPQFANERNWHIQWIGIESA